MVESPNLVQEDGNEEKSDDAEEQTQDDTPGELRRSKRTRRPPIQDDDPRYSISSYSRQKVPEDLDKLKDSALVMTDPSTYQEAMSRPDAIYWKKACAEELEQFVKQKLFSTVCTPVGQKVEGASGSSKQKLTRMDRWRSTRLDWWHRDSHRYLGVTNFIQSYLHQFFDDSHGLKASLKPLRRPFN